MFLPLTTRLMASVYDAVVTMRRHWPFGVVSLVGLVLRIAATVAYRPALVYIDTARYLGEDERGLDPLGYKFLLLEPLLKVHAGLEGVAITQHVLGLAMGTCVYALVARHGGARWIAVLAAAPVLLDAYQVQAEQEIMPDVLFEALLVTAIMLLLWPSADWPSRAPGPGLSAHSPNPCPSLARLTAAAAIIGVSATVRQVGELLVIPLVAYTLLSYPHLSHSPLSRPLRSHARLTRTLPTMPAWRVRLIRATLTIVVLALPVVAYMALSAGVLGTGLRLSDMDDSYLYARVAHAADCATLRVPLDEKPLCPTGPAAALSVDALATDPVSPVYRYVAPPGITAGAEISAFDRAVLTQQPLRVAAAIAGDAVKVFALTRDGAPDDPPISRWQFQVSYPVYQPADREVLGADAPRVVVPLATALRAYQLHGGFTPGPLLLLFLLSGTTVAASRRFPASIRLACLLATGLAVASLLGTDLYEFSWRYQLPALVTLPLAGAIAFGEAARMITCPMNRLARTARKSGRSRAASCIPTPGSGFAKTISSAPTAPAEAMPSSSETTSP
jgi:hypothetical protein